MLETKVVAVFDHALAGGIVDEDEDGQDDGELWDADAGVTESVDDIPRMAEPGDFGKDETAN